MNGLASILALGTSLVILQMPPANAIEITCPADVYSSEYEEYLSRMRNLLNFSIEPQIYGTKDEIDRLQRDFSKLSFESDTGVTFVFTDTDLKKLYKADCQNCSTSTYEKLSASCSVALEGRCIDFAVVIDGKPQCMLTPKPEF